MVHQVPATRLDIVLIDKKKKICHPVDFAIPVNHRLKVKVKDRQILLPSQ